MYVVLRDELERSFDASLLANAEHAAGAFAQDVDVNGRLRPLSRLLDQFASTGGRVIVLDPNGAELARSTSPRFDDLPITAADLAAPRRARTCGARNQRRRGSAPTGR